MSKAADDNKSSDGEVRSHYDFSQGVRGRYRHFMGKPHTLTIHHADGSTTVDQIEEAEGAIFLAPDVREYFPDSEAVNRALRGLIDLIPQAQRDKASNKVK
jgi:hypothetical protein